EMRQVIRQLLGPTALDPIDDLASTDDDEALDDEALDDELGGDEDETGSLTLESPLLGSGGGGGGPSPLGGGGGGPSLLGDGERPSLMGGRTPPLGAGDLRLNLGE